MKIVLLSTATGQGHNAAAMAVREYLDEQGCQTWMLDVLNTGKRNVSQPISRLYDNIVLDTPWLFNGLYRAGELITSNRHHSPVYLLNALTGRNLSRILNEIRPDALLCPHLFGAQAITRLRENYGLSTPVVGLATDYGYDPFWEETRLDRYIVPSASIRDEYIRRGIPGDRVIPIGIPVSTRFRRRTPREEARQVFGLTAQRVFLVMGGSMGYGRIGALADALLSIQPDSQVVALCGRNQRLRESLEGRPGIVALPFTDKVEVLMDAADVVLTKPGGLSTTEAMVKGVPLILTRPIPGCETRNAAYLGRLGVALCAQDEEQAVAAARRLMTDPDAVARMRAAQAAQIDAEANCRVGEILMSLAAECRTFVAG